MDQTTTDKIWIPSYDEIIGKDALYYRYFQDEDSHRVRKKTGMSDTSWWWLRSSSGNANFQSVYTDGHYGNNYGANSPGAVVLGFCM